MLILRRSNCVYTNIQHVVSSLSMSGRGGRAVHRLRESSLSPCVLHGHQMKERERTVKEIFKFFLETKEYNF